MLLAVPVRPTVITVDQRAWTECHVAAFEFFGGVPARLVPDNLKTGVDRPDLYDPRINRSYAELAAHYGCLVDPARSRKPRDKAQIERPMPYIGTRFWRGREFTCLAQMQAEAVRWSAEVAGQRSCRPLEGAAPAAVFAAAEAGALAPLPKAPFVLAEWSRCKVGPDIHAKVGKSLYSVPWRHLGKTLDARSTATMVQLFLGGELVKTHVRKAQGKQTDLADYPRRRSPSTCAPPPGAARRATEIGPASTALIGGLLADNALYRLRAAQGVLHLADKHRPGRLGPPAPQLPPPETRPTGPSRACSPPAPRPHPSQRHRSEEPRRSCTAPRPCSPPNPRCRGQGGPAAARYSRHPGGVMTPLTAPPPAAMALLTTPPDADRHTARTH